MSELNIIIMEEEDVDLPPRKTNTSPWPAPVGLPIGSLEIRMDEEEGGSDYPETVNPFDVPGIEIVVRAGLAQVIEMRKPRPIGSYPKPVLPPASNQEQIAA